MLTFKMLSNFLSNLGYFEIPFAMNFLIEVYNFFNRLLYFVLKSINGISHLYCSHGHSEETVSLLLLVSHMKIYGLVPGRVIPQK